MAGYGEADKRLQKDKSRTGLSQSSRLLAPTRSSLAKSAPKSSEAERGRRQSDVTDLSSNGRDGHKEGRARRSSYPAEDSSSLDHCRGSSTTRSGTSRTSSTATSGRPKAAESKGTYGVSSRQDRNYADGSSPEKSVRSSPEKSFKSSPDKGRKGLKPVNVSPSSQRAQGRASPAGLGGERTPTSIKTNPGLPTSPRSQARPEQFPTSPRAIPESYPTSPRAVGIRNDSMPRSPHGGKSHTESSRSSVGRKDKAPVQRSTLNPSKRSLGQPDVAFSLGGSESMGFKAWTQGREVQGIYGSEEHWPEEGSMTLSGGLESLLDRSGGSAFGQVEGYEQYDSVEPALQGWPAGVVSRDALLNKHSAALLQQEGAHITDITALSASERSSNLDDEDEVHKPSGLGPKGGKADEGSPVSVLDASATELRHMIKPQDIMPRGAQSTVQVSASWPGDALEQSSVVPLENHEDGLNAAAAAVAAAIGSPLPAYLLDISNLDFMGDITGMEQDLEYVRHVLLLSGFAGKVLPPVFSEVNPIHPGVFEQLEQGITTGSVEGAHDAIIIDKARQAEERRQRRLLFDAVNEALGRRLMPYYARPTWVKPSQPVIKKLPLGKNLLQEVWEEIHDWPIASSDEVYDILDDAARRDMSRGTERWVEMGQEKAESIFELEKLLLEDLAEEIAREISAVEYTKKERRQLARKTSKTRRELIMGR